MSNPLFNELRRCLGTSGPPARVGSTRHGRPRADPAGHRRPGVGLAEVDDGVGVISASAVLLVLILVSGTFGWMASWPTLENGTEAYQFPPLAFLGIIVGFGAVIVLYFKPNLAKVLGPVYAIAYGFAVGAISKGYETFQNGIVLQAVLATASVFTVMLVLYRTGIVKVTDKYRRIVIGATLGVMVLYGMSIIISLFGGEIGFSTARTCSGSASRSSSAPSPLPTWRSTST